MATLTLFQQFKEDLAKGVHNFTATDLVLSASGGATKAQFRDAIIKEFVKDKVRAYRIKQDIALQPTRVAEPDVT